MENEAIQALSLADNETIQAIALMLGAAWAAGINIYAAVLVLGLLILDGRVLSLWHASARMR